MANPGDLVTPHALGAETASDTGEAIDLGEDLPRTAARLALELTAIASVTVTKTGDGPDVTFAGTPADPAADFVVEITTEGELGVGAYHYSLDGGLTFEAEATIPEGGVAELGSTGITVTFDAGTYEVDTTYEWSKRLLVTLETSADGATGWRTVDSWDAKAAPGKTEQAFASLERYVRVSWALSGESATFKVSGQAHQVYFDESDMRAEVPGRAFETETSASDIAAAILQGSADIEDHCASAYTMPITAWPISVSQRGAQRGIYYLLSRRGFDPEGPDRMIEVKADEAMKWLKRVSQGQLRPPGIVDSTPDTYEGGAVVVSSPRRW